MATSGQLIKALSDAIGVSPRTIFLYDRILSEAGVRSKTGRGRSAAAMTSTDAANLLIATLSSPVSGPSIKSSLDQWRTYSQLEAGEGDLSSSETDRHKRLTSGKWELPFINLRNLSSLDENHTISAAISGIIDWLTQEDADFSQHFFLRFNVYAPTPITELFISAGNSGYEMHYYHQPRLLPLIADPRRSLSLLARGHGRDGREHDLGQQRWVTTHTMIALAHSLRGDDVLTSLLTKTKPRPA